MKIVGPDLRMEAMLRAHVQRVKQEREKGEEMDWSESEGSVEEMEEMDWEDKEEMDWKVEEKEEMDWEA